MKTAFIYIVIALFSSASCSEPFYYFIPPSNWKVIAPEKLSRSIKIAFVASSKKAFKPSLNLGVEKVDVSLDEYIIAVKKQHTSNRKNRWHEVGFLNTLAGKAHLSQIDTKAEYGDIRSMQSILVQDGYAYVITAVTLRDDFLNYHNEFIKAFESFSISKDSLSSLSSSVLKSCYTKKTEELLQSFHKLLASNNTAQEAFESSLFKKKHWKSFEKYLSQTFKDQGVFWQVMASKEIKTNLIASRD
ncbi:MAG: hypothetical protein WCG10_00615 [Chlamydiota bacterium]